MVHRHYRMPDNDPEQMKFQLPSEREHLFQVLEVNEKDINVDIVSVKAGVMGGPEDGRTLLHRLNLDPDSKGFFATRLFLKSIGQPHKGPVNVNTDEWLGKKFYATVIHAKSKDQTKTYANIETYNFEKIVEGVQGEVTGIPKESDTVAWDE